MSGSHGNAHEGRGLTCPRHSTAGAGPTGGGRLAALGARPGGRAAADGIQWPLRRPLSNCARPPHRLIAPSHTLRNIIWPLHAAFIVDHLPSLPWALQPGCQRPRRLHLHLPPPYPTLSHLPPPNPPPGVHRGQPVPPHLRPSAGPGHPHAHRHAARPRAQVSSLGAVGTGVGCKNCSR